LPQSFDKLNEISSTAAVSNINFSGTDKLGFTAIISGTINCILPINGKVPNKYLKGIVL
jgi:hypothetical protein